MLPLVKQSFCETRCPLHAPAVEGAQ
jgi:hypothetical protein